MADEKAIIDAAIADGVDDLAIFTFLVRRVNDPAIFALFELRVNDLTIFTFDIPKLHKCSASVDLLKLIESEFAVGHWFEVWWRCFPPMHTTSLGSTTRVMTSVIHGCDLGHGANE